MQNQYQPRKRMRNGNNKAPGIRGDDGHKKARNGQPGRSFHHSTPVPAAFSDTFPSSGAPQAPFGGLVSNSAQQTNKPQSDRGDGQPYSSLSGKLDLRLLEALEVMQFTYMSSVQQTVLTRLPDYRADCLVRAKTGTGKTVAFFLPALHSLLNSQPLPHGQVGILVLSPTRELALQIAKECDQLTSQMPRPLECHTAFGGTARASNLNKFMRGAPSILVATPGRLLDYLAEPATAAKLSNILTLILDEADTMLEKGFLQNVKDILRMLPPKHQTGWQGMCFSATMPEKMKDVIHTVLYPGYTSLSNIDENETPTIDRVPQYHVITPSVSTIFTTLTSLLDTESRSNRKILVFGVTANMVVLFSKLFAQGLTSFRVYELHSRLSQNIRTRTTAEYKAATSGVLFASDVVGRGMDFPNVDLVVQVGLLSNAEQYIHRVGRTGRADKEGRAVILLTHGESFFLRQNSQLPIHPHPASAEIVANSAACAPRVEAAMNQIDEVTKQRAYSSYLGFFAGSGLMKPLRLDKARLVLMANEMAFNGMYCPESPRMEKKTINKMGLKGVANINYAIASQSEDVRTGGVGGSGGRCGGGGRERW